MATQTINDFQINLLNVMKLFLYILSSMFHRQISFESWVFVFQLRLAVKTAPLRLRLRHARMLEHGEWVYSNKWLIWFKVEGINRDYNQLLLWQARSVKADLTTMGLSIPEANSNDVILVNNILFAFVRTYL